MGADNSLQILIEIITKELGPEKADAVMKKYTEETKKSSAEVEKSTAKHGELKKAVHLLGQQFGEAGRVASFFFQSTLVGATAIAALIVGKMVGAWKSWGDAVDGMANTAMQRIGDMKGALHELDVERAAADEAFHTAHENLDRAAQSAIDRIHEEKQAVLELADAREKFELSQATTDEAKTAITQRYANVRRGVDQDAMQAEIAAKERQIAELQQLAMTRGAQAAAQAGGLTPDQAAAHLKNLKQEQADLRKQAEDSDKYASEMKPGFWLNVSKHLSPWGWQAVSGMESAAESSEVMAQRLRGAAAQAGRREVPLTAAVTGDKEVREILKQIGSLKRERDALSSGAGFQRIQTTALSSIAGGRDSAALLSTAATGADVIAAGGKASQTQVRAITEATRALGLSNQNAETILGILGRINDRADYFERSLKTIERRVNTSANSPRGS